MLKAKVADTPHKVEQGLMGVKDMPSDEGMVFMFPHAKTLSFWGRNTFIPLDIAFIDIYDTIVKIENIEPFNESPVSSDVRCQVAIEVNAGYFNAHDISVGDKVVIDRGSFKDDAEITFRKTAKDSTAKQGKIKESQVAGTPVVNKPGENPIGVPIADQPEQPTIEQNLPVVSPSDIGQYLEDSFDEEEESPKDGLDGNIDQQSPEGVEQPEQPEVDEEQVEFPVFSTPTEATEWAKDNNQVVRIDYTTKRGRHIVRDIEPHGTFHSESTMREILVTYDETVSGIRAFILSNIGNWAFVGRQFQKKFVVKA